MPNVQNQQEQAFAPQANRQGNQGSKQPGSKPQQQNDDDSRRSDDARRSSKS